MRATEGLYKVSIGLFWGYTGVFLPQYDESHVKENGKLNGNCAYSGL